MITARRALVGLVALAVVVVGVHVAVYRELSPIDELQHLDYAIKVGEGDLVARGELFGQEALREEACRGIDANFLPPPCELRRFDPATFQEEGYNTAYIHPPTYYAVAAVGAYAWRALTPSDSHLTGARLAGALWLAGGMLVLWLLLAELAVPVTHRLWLGALVALAPSVLHATATVNPDGSALVAGGAVLLAVLRWERGASPVWAGIAAVVAIALKSTNVIGVGLAGLYVLLRRGRGSGRGVARSWLPPAVALAAGAAVALGAWLVVTSSLALVPGDEIPMIRRFRSDGVDLADVLDSITAGFSPLQNPHLIPELNNWLGRTWWHALDRLLLAGLVVAAIRSLPGSRERSLVVATVAGLALMGPAVVLVNEIGQGIYVTVPSRYGLSAVPACVAAIGTALVAGRGDVERWSGDGAAADGGVRTGVVDPVEADGV